MIDATASGSVWPDDEVVISVRDLGKRYKMYERPRDMVKEVLSLGRRSFHRDFWALRNVSFNVRKGETIGLVGRNGSGKSTLLQLICGTTTPTSGFIRIRGRVAALLELGSGFSPEFTGRENAYLNASILGLSKKEIDERFPSIAEFADIGDFIDQPVKKYSSGMYVRLAFSVAINVNPDILVVDEALAVGDEVFQRKCFGRIEKIKATGATILFVSHSSEAVMWLCDRAFLLDRGEILLGGAPKLVLGHYHQLSAAPPENHEALRNELMSLDPGAHLVEECGGQVERVSMNLKNGRRGPFFDPDLVSSGSIRYVSKGARLSRFQITTLAGEPVNNLIPREEYIYSYFVEFSRSFFSVQFGMLLKNTTGVELGGYATPPGLVPTQPIEAGAKLRVRFRFRCVLRPGTYFMNAGVFTRDRGYDEFLDRCLDAITFKVLPRDEDYGSYMVDFIITPSVSLLDRPE